MTPYMKHARVGYRDPRRQELGSVGDLFPENLRNDRSPYRVVGTYYTTIHGDTLDTAMSIGHPSPLKVCTECHGITNKGTGRFTSDAVARLGELPDDNAPENQFRTAWAERSGLGKIHPWMLPVAGQDISQTPLAEPISEDEWQKLKAAIIDPTSISGSKKIYTATPAPGSGSKPETLLADPSVPLINEVIVTPAENGKIAVISINWTYANSLGGVPERDDVRFNVAIREVPKPTDDSEPPLEDYPSREVTKGSQAVAISDEISRQGDVLIVQNASFQGHQKFTDPAPTLQPRNYTLKFPGEPGRRYLIRILPKRFGFDRGGEVFSELDFVRFADVPHNP